MLRKLPFHDDWLLVAGVFVSGIFIVSLVGADGMESAVRHVEQAVLYTLF
jgi:hypothetical protein